MMISYAKFSSAEKNEKTIKDKLISGVIVNRGIKVKLEIQFFNLEGDMYLATDYSSDMKLIYNENSLGNILKKNAQSSPNEKNNCY